MRREPKEKLRATVQQVRARIRSCTPASVIKLSSVGAMSKMTLFNQIDVLLAFKALGQNVFQQQRLLLRTQILTELVS
jgi:hypothetical protein